MKPATSPDGLDIPPALLAEIQAAAEQEHRPALDVLQDAVRRYVRERRGNRAVFRTEALTETELAAMTSGSMDARRNHLDGGTQPSHPPRRRTPAEAGARLRELRQGRFLPEGETIRSLIDAGRR